MDFFIILMITEYVSNAFYASRLKKRMRPEPVPFDSNIKLSLANSAVCFLYTWLIINRGVYDGLVVFIIGQFVLEWYLRYLSKL